MPYYPTINEIPATREMIDTFGGYNHNLIIADGEFYDMKNLTSSSFPVLSQRNKRGVYASPASPQGLISKDALCYVDGSKFYINGLEVAGLVLSTAAADCPKQLVSMGAYVVIFPDKKYVNTADITEYGSLEVSNTSGTTVSFSMWDMDSAGYISAPTTKPSIPINGALWIDTSTTPHTLKKYSASSEQWISVLTTYVKITGTGIGVGINKYDGVKISGVTAEALSDLNNTMIVQDCGNNFITVIGIVDTLISQYTSVTVTRTVPKMDYVVEAGNRLWGCRYGLNSAGETVNEIYASKLGDFKNWQCFQGIATDSWYGHVGSDGVFTGAVTHLGYPLFFKENVLHKIYISAEGAHRIVDTTCRGVQRDCSKSLSIVNETLFYKSQSAVCAYDGSLPTEVSEALGDATYSNAIAGALGNKYYISMKDASDVWHLFVFDLSRGTWHKEDNTHAEAFCACRGELYYIDSADKKIKTVNGSGTADTSTVEWMAETGQIGLNSPDNKYISRFNIRMSLTSGSSMTIYVQYDSSGTWEQLYSISGSSLQSFTVPIKPRRCDHMKIKLTGTGEFKLYSIAKTVKRGSDIQ